MIEKKRLVSRWMIGALVAAILWGLGYVGLGGGRSERVAPRAESVASPALVVQSGAAGVTNAIVRQTLTVKPVPLQVVDVQVEQPSPAMYQLLQEYATHAQGFIPPKSYRLQVTAVQRTALAQVPGVVSVAEPAFESFFAPALYKRLTNEPPETEVDVVVRAYSVAEADGVSAAAQAAGATLLSRSRAHVGLRMTLGACAALVRAQPGVAEVDQKTKLYARNNIARSAEFTGSAVFQAAGGLFTGAGEIVSCSDTGLSTGNPTTYHRDLRGQVLRAVGEPWSMMTWPDAAGHGTHVAGTIIGSGAASNGLYAGHASGAKLFFQMVGNGSADGGVFVPDDLADLMAQAESHGAFIHSASWGGPVGAYGSYARSIDAYVYEHPDFLFVMAAGNEAVDANRDGVVDHGSIDATATGKNCISVGAQESHRPDLTAVYTLQEFGAPIGGSSKTEPSTPGTHGLFANSSRGPTSDGRLKPDIVAPGTGIHSLDLSETGYTDLNGSSMATPAVSGAAAIVREYLRTQQFITQPSAMLVKALLLNGAQSLSPGQYDTGNKREIATDLPNPDEGFGALSLVQTLAPTGAVVQIYDDLYADAVVETNAQTFTVTVTDAGHPLSATLVWADPPSLLSSPGLIHDYDLQITAPNGLIYHGNGGASPDRVNPSERIRISAADVGTYTVTVTPHQVVQSGGCVALVVSAASETPPEIFHHPIEAVLQSEGGVTLSAYIHNPPTAGAACTVTYRFAEGVAQTANLVASNGVYTVRIPFDTTYEGELTYTLHSGTTALPSQRVVIGPPVTLTVSSTPLPVLPLVGTHTLVKGQTVRATAYKQMDYAGPWDNYTASTWVAESWFTTSGQSGTGSQATFTIDQAMTLTWTTTVSAPPVASVTCVESNAVVTVRGGRASLHLLIANLAPQSVDQTLTWSAELVTEQTIDVFDDYYVSSTSGTVSTDNAPWTLTGDSSLTLDLSEWSLSTIGLTCVIDYAFQLGTEYAGELCWSDSTGTEVYIGDLMGYVDRRTDPLGGFDEFIADISYMRFKVAKKYATTESATWQIYGLEFRRTVPVLVGLSPSRGMVLPADSQDVLVTFTPDMSQTNLILRVTTNEPDASPFEFPFTLQRTLDAPGYRLHIK